jgi:hypothetical protein
MLEELAFGVVSTQTLSKAGDKAARLTPDLRDTVRCVRGSSRTIAIVVLAAACAGRSDDGPGEGSVGSTSSASTSTTSDSDGSADATTTGESTADTSTSGSETAAVSCADAFPDCGNAPDCESVSAVHQSYNETDGCYFSDLSVPVGCAESSCSPAADKVICRDGDPESIAWVLQGCIPLGWSECEETCPFD